ncbi:hypothetical protein SDC9_76478 [bioreactor metagenome]|uniref:Uncharacterized protein n=1 Tax=bioreactor metagenome TaxID=1076179 RepID=A0A644YN51_9ZZZZ
MVLESLDSHDLGVDTKMELHPMGLDELDIALNGFNGKPEAWNDMPDHTTCTLLPFKDCSVETCTSEEICGREACRAGSYHSGLDQRLIGRSFPQLLESLEPILHRNALHIADFHRSFIIHAGTVKLALVVADVTGNRRKGVLVINQGKGFTVATLANQLHVLRNILVNRASNLTRGNITIKEGKLLPDLDRIITAELFAGHLKVGGSGSFRKLLQLLQIDAFHRPGFAGVQDFHHLLEAGVPTRLEHIGGKGNRADTTFKEILDCECCSPSAVGDRKPAGKLFAQQCCNLGGDGKQRTSGHIHLVTGKHALVVDRTQGIGEFYTKTPVLFLGKVDQAVKHGNGITILQVMLKVLTRKGNVRKAKVIKDLAHCIVAEQGGVELDECIYLLLGNHVGTDGLNLFRRTAVHGTQGGRRADVGTDLGADALQFLLKSFPRSAFEETFVEHCFQLAEILVEPCILACIDHGIDVLLHSLRLDALEVIPNGHIEDKGRFLKLAFVHRCFEQVQDDPSLCILVPSLG